MKHLLTSAAVVAALAISAPVWAQPANPSGGNPMGMPGPSPGGPGLTPYSTGTQTAPARPAAPPPSAAAPSSSAPSSMSSPSASDTSSATPPTRRHARKGSHGKMAGHHATRRGRGPQLTGTTANQLNQEELQRLQAGNFSNPAAPPAPGMAPPPRSMEMPGPRSSGASGAGPR
jgi:hypothetical protein